MRLDLNLLIVLDSLLSEGSVTRAAQRLHLAQPTVSNALARLREVFKDPLLIRVGREMKPTQKARELIAPLREALGQLDKAVGNTADFNPATTVRTIRIATTDYVAAVLVPELLAYLGAHAPNMQVVITDLNATDPLGGLHSGDIDLLLGGLSTTNPYIHRCDLLTDKYVCVVRKGHPSIRGKISVKQFLETPHLVVHQQNGASGGTLDELINQMAVKRNVAITLTSPHYFSATYALLCSDVVLTVASRIGNRIGHDFPLQVLKLPIPLKPFLVSQLWHKRMHDDPAHAWFRKALVHIASSLEHEKHSERRSRKTFQKQRKR